MAAISFRLFLFSLSTISIFVHAKLSLDVSDENAFKLIKKDLGIRSQRSAAGMLCNFPGVICERRILGSSYILRITRIVLKSNQLKGYLSPEIGKVSELRELSLPNNQLVGQIPPQIINCRKLEILNLRNNRFSGEVPSELTFLIRLRVLDLSKNRFSGNLNFLKYFPNLEKLSLSDNLFTGKVPASLKSFPNLKFINLSGNHYLEGPVSVPKSQFSKLEFSQENNVPKRYFLSENSTMGNQPNNTKAATAPKASRNTTTNSTIKAPSPSPSTTNKHTKSKKKAKVWAIGFFAGAAAGSVSGFVFSVIGKLLLAFIRGRGKESGPVIFSPLIKKAEDLAFLERDDGLASLEIIGKGGCGEVYKSELPGSGGKMIAIKKIIQPPKDAAELTEEDSKFLSKKMRQIRSEINTVGQIRHRNLLPLLAHISRPDCHYLVYEYMKNGSLQDVLTSVSQGQKELDWLARHKIALGVASGLEYLHLDHSQRIIHRDLKPGNILLDDQMEARIADFGLAKPVPEAHTHVTTSNIAGTVGYIAPEYHQTLKFTEKCDIYSFGVVLGVLVIGKMPSDEFFQHTQEMSLVKWMRNVMISEDPSRAIDPDLKGKGNDEKMLLVLKIACFCTLEDPKQRPNSRDVRCMLSQISNEN